MKRQADNDAEALADAMTEAPGVGLFPVHRFHFHSLCEESVCCFFLLDDEVTRANFVLAATLFGV
jgi:hypothetical protein